MVVVVESRGVSRPLPPNVLFSRKTGLTLHLHGIISPEKERGQIKKKKRKSDMRVACMEEGIGRERRRGGKVRRGERWARRTLKVWSQQPPTFC